MVPLGMRHAGVLMLPGYIDVHNVATTGPAIADLVAHADLEDPRTERCDRVMRQADFKSSAHHEISRRLMKHHARVAIGT